MTSIQNHFFKLKDLKIEGLKLGVSILQSFPMSAIAIMVIRSKLVEATEIGLFEPGSEIIQQGEKGFDLFVILDQDVDVKVNQQFLVTMPAPNLLGEKALIQKDNTRSASILIAGESPALVLKIPMGLFLHELDHAEIPDSFYIREKKIYLGLFLQIQKRLFHYVKLQNTNYKILHDTVQNLNTRWLAINMLEKAGKEWPPEVFQHLKPFLSARFHYKPQGEFPLEIEPLLVGLKQFFVKKFSKGDFQGNEEEFKIIQKNVWSQWLHQMASHILSVVPHTALAYDLEEVSLVDLTTYRGKIVNYAKQLDANFPRRTKKPWKEGLKECFERGSQAGKFNLKKFQDLVVGQYVVRYPKRVEASIGQSLALLAAETENQFNHSISIIKGHLKNIEKLDLVIKHIKGKDPTTYARNLSVVRESFTHFLKTIMSGSIKENIGEASFHAATCPTLENLLNASGTQERKDQISNASYNLIQDLDLIHSILPSELLEHHYNYARALSDFQINPQSLGGNYWIPLTEGVRFLKNGKLLTNLDRGSILGGKAYLDFSDGEIKIQAPARKQDGPIDQDALFLVITDPIVANQSQPDRQKMWMDWIVNAHLTEISILSESQETAHAEYMHLSLMYQRDAQILKFESGELEFSAENQKDILKYLKAFLGYSQESESFSSKELSENVQAYIASKEPAATDDAESEERQNSIFTQWRFALVNMIGLMEIKEESEGSHEASVVLQLHDEIHAILTEHKVEKIHNYLEIQEESIKLNLPSLIRALDLKKPALITFYRDLITRIEGKLLQLRIDLSELEQKSAQMMKIGETLEDEGELQKKVIAELSKKLKDIFLEKAPTLTAEEPVEEDATVAEVNSEATATTEEEIAAEDETTAEEVAPEAEATAEESAPESPHPPPQEPPEEQPVEKAD